MPFRLRSLGFPEERMDHYDFVEYVQRGVKMTTSRERVAWKMTGNLWISPKKAGRSRIFARSCLETPFTIFHRIPRKPEAFRMYVPKSKVRFKCPTTQKDIAYKLQT
jgi:hypothetical protein